MTDLNRKKDSIQIKMAESSDLVAVAELAQQLWQHHTVEELYGEMAEYLSSGAIFLAWETEGDKMKEVGFAQCSLRHDYVEGTSKSPVGYLEGIFVLPAYRRCGISQKLLQACQEWAKQQGCCEFASDCELENKESLCFHLACGFQEANRIICFVKKI